MVGVARIELATPAMARPATYANPRFTRIREACSLDLANEFAIDAACGASLVKKCDDQG